MEFRVLGPIEFWATGIRKDLGTAKERLLLAVLLLAEGRPVPVDTLIDRVWGQNPPAEVRQSLQTDLSRLRRRFKKYGVTDTVRLIATPGAYALEVPPGQVDVFRSRALREQAISRRRSGNTRGAVELLRDGANLWRAEPLTGISGEWVDQMRASLDGDYRAMARELVEIEIATGNQAEIIGFLVDLIARYPLDESFIGHLMLAYYHCGRQADAIALYRTTARLLRKNADAAPSPRLQTLFRNIRRHDPSVAAPQRSSTEPIPGLDRLPPSVPEFTGRATELAALAAEVGTVGGVVVIEGMPSVGKTALAIKAAHELAERFPDGCFFLALHGHDAQRLPESQAAALSTLLQLVGIAPAGIPQEPAARARLWRDAMEGRRALLILDDAANEDQVRLLLPGNSDCHVIITSRRHLPGVEGGHHRLGVLPTSEAIVLFTRIAESAAADSGGSVADAVRLCGGLPLAIRLAATRLRDRQVPSIGGLVEELRGPHEDIADLQHPALAATFALSYRDLPITQRRIFRRLGLSPEAELTAPAFAVLAGISVREAERSLADFVDQYLIEETSPGRFRLHDLVRRYAMALPAGEDPEFDGRRAVGRTLDYFLLKADLADRALFPHHVRTEVAAERSVAVEPFEDEEAATGWLSAERKNLIRLIQYAADHSWNTHAIDYARTVARYFDSVSQWEEAELIHRRALNVALELELPRAIAQARFNLAVVQWRLGQMDKALSNATKAEQIAHRVHDTALKAAALDQVGLVAWSSSKYREALAYFGETLDLYQVSGDVRGKAECLNHLGMMLAQIGRHRDALRSFYDALDSFQAIGDIRGEATTLSNLAHAHLLLGYHRDAYELYQKSRDIYRTLTGRRNQAILSNNLGDVARYRGRHDTALRHYGEALAEFLATGDRINESNVLNNMGLALSGMEQYNEAMARHRSAMAVAKTIGNTSEKVRAMLGIADVQVGVGQYSGAIENYRAARRLARHIGDPNLEAQALSGIAHVTNLTRGSDAARIYWRQAYDLFSQLNIVPEMEAVRIRLDLIDLTDS